MEFTEIFRGDDGKTSGKSLLGTVCISVALALTTIASIKCSEHLAEQAVLIAPVFATGVAFWGLKSWQTITTGKTGPENVSKSN